jgi:hypothetical protein
MRNVRRIQPIQANAMIASIVMINDKLGRRITRSELTNKNTARLVDLTPVEIGPQRLWELVER